MPQPSVPTETDLQDQIDSPIEILDSAYVPESTREEFVEAIGSAVDVLRDEDEEEKEDEDDEDDEEDEESGD